MDNTWVKLYRKLGDNEIMQDSTALQVFIWILLQVNKKTGELTTGRFIGSRELGLNSNTFYKALKRLEKKHKIVTLTSNNKYTTVSLLNWSKYNQYNESVTQSGNNKVTTKEQQSNTPIYIQDIKTYRHKEGELKLTPDKILKLKEEYPYVDIDKTYEKFRAWQKANGRQFDNVLEAFRVWLIEDNTKNKPRKAIIL